MLVEGWVPTEQRVAKEGERTLSTLPRQAGLEASHGDGLGLEVTADVMPFARGTQRDNGLHKNENAAVPCCHVKQVQRAIDLSIHGVGVRLRFLGKRGSLDFGS